MIIETTIQKWGNGLALRVAGAMREIPGFTAGTPVKVEITDKGFSVRKTEPPKKSKKRKINWPVTEEELLKNIGPADPDLLVTRYLDDELPPYEE